MRDRISFDIKSPPVPCGRADPLRRISPFFCKYYSAAFPILQEKILNLAQRFPAPAAPSPLPSGGATGRGPGPGPGGAFPSRTRLRRVTVSPQWAHIRRTWRFFPSWMVTESLAAPPFGPAGGPGPAEGLAVQGHGALQPLLRAGPIALDPDEIFLFDLLAGWSSALVKAPVVGSGAAAPRSPDPAAQRPHPAPRPSPDRRRCRRPFSSARAVTTPRGL